MKFREGKMGRRESYNPTKLFDRPGKMILFSESMIGGSVQTTYQRMRCWTHAFW